MTRELQILWESYWAGFVVPVVPEATFFALLSFGEQPILFPALIAALGATLGNLVSWMLGLMLNYYRVQGKLRFPDRWHAQLQHIWHRYAMFLLLLTWLPLFNLFSIAAGFATLRLRLFLPLVAAGQIAYYLWLSLSHS